MNKLQVGGLVAILAFVTACDGCGPPPPPAPDPARCEVTVDRPTGAIADGADRVQIRVTVRDTNGDPVGDTAVTIVATGTGNTLGQPDYPTDANGVATGTLSTTVAETKTLSASIAEGDIPATATAVFGPGPVSASSSTVAAAPATVVADGADSAAVTVTLRDANGNAIPGKAVTLSATGAQNTLGQPVATDARGQTAGALRSTVAEAKVVTATVDGTALQQQPSLQFVAGPPARLAFAAQPSDAVAGTAIAPAIQVAIQDAAGNLITTGSDVVTVSLEGAGTLSGTTSAAASGGIATFSGLSVNRAQAGATLVAAATGLASATSLPFGILPGPADHLAFSTQPTTARSGAAVAPAVRVAVQDALGNTIPTDTRTISLALGNNPGGATLSGTTTAAASGGVATFDTLSLDRAGTGYTLVAAAGGVTGAESGGFDVTAGPASKLAFAVQPPASVTSDAAFTPPVQVAIQDAAGNTVPTATGAITLSLTGGTAGAVLSGALTQAAAGGVATFTGLSVDLAGAGYALDAAGAALTGAASTTFSVVPGAPSKLVFFTQPPDAVAGQPISPPPSVAVTDAAGNVVSTATDAITVSLSGGTAGAVLSGTLTRNASSGVATFDGLSVDRSGAGYALGAAAASLTSGSSATFSIGAGPPDRLAVTAQPVNSRAGQLFTVGVTVQDALGNTSPSPAQTVVLSLASGPSATLGGTTSLTTTAGVASFTDLHIDTLGSGFSIGAAAGSLTPATTNPFNISADVPSQLAFVQQPGTGYPNTALAPPITVAIRDRFGNPTTSVAAVTMSLALRPDGGVLSGTTAVGAVNGISTFSNLSLNLLGTYQMGASSVGLTGATSNTFDVVTTDITGTRIIHHVLENGGIIDRPQDLRFTTIGAMVPDGGSYSFIAGVGTDAGTFRIQGVPGGITYYLRFDNDYFDTSSRVFDLGSHAQGRPDVQRADGGTYQHNFITGMAPWELDPVWGVEDDLEMYSANANVWFNPLELFAADGGVVNPGETQLDQVLDYGQLAAVFTPNLVDAARGDTTWILQESVHDAGFWDDGSGFPLARNYYLALERSLGPLALTVADGQTTTVNGTFSTPPESTLTVDWRTRDTTPGSFASFRTAIHPSTLGDLYEHDFFLEALPSGSYGFYGSAPDLVAMFLQDSTRPSQNDQLITFSYRDPFPASWTRFAQAASVFAVPYDVPRTGTDGGTAFTTESAFLLALDALPTFPVSPLRPQVSPVTNPLVNGASWFSNQTLSSTTPLISWSAPAVGTPDFYSLRIRRVSAGPTGGVVKTEVARLVTRASSLRVPPGILQPGSYYLLRLTAAVQPGRTQTATYESPFPLHTAPVMSGVLRTP